MFDDETDDVCRRIQLHFRTPSKVMALASYSAFEKRHLHELHPSMEGPSISERHSKKQKILLERRHEKCVSHLNHLVLDGEEKNSQMHPAFKEIIENSRIIKVFDQRRISMSAQGLPILPSFIYR